MRIFVKVKRFIVSVLGKKGVSSMALLLSMVLVLYNYFHSEIENREKVLCDFSTGTEVLPDVSRHDILWYYSTPKVIQESSYYFILRCNVKLKNSNIIPLGGEKIDDKIDEALKYVDDAIYSKIWEGNYQVCRDPMCPASYNIYRLKSGNLLLEITF